jgi:hypothetical protein
MPDNVRECAVAVQAPTDARAERGVAMPLDYWRSIAAETHFAGGASRAVRH